MSYDTQGALVAQGAYAEGKRIGTWFFYNDQEIKQVQYQDGRMTQVDRMAKTDTRVVSQFE
jgi:antitoxin component YwqK of YwqJK toxin-antitoxin module